MEIRHVQYFQKLAAGLLRSRKWLRLWLGKPPCDVQRQGVRICAEFKELGTDKLVNSMGLELRAM